MADTATLGTIEHIDPAQIEVETNVRTIVKVDTALVASIRELGVLEPVVCRRTQDGSVSVRMGQRRVLAAREAEYKARFANPFVAGSRGFIDDVILPSETRKRICRSLVMLKNKQLENPWRKHGNIPL